MRCIERFRQAFSDGKRTGRRLNVQKSGRRSGGLSKIERDELDRAIAKCNSNVVTHSATLVERTDSDNLDAIKSTTAVLCEQCGKVFDYPSDGYHAVRDSKSFYVCDIFCARWAANDIRKGCIIHEPSGYVRKYERLTLYPKGKERAKCGV